MTDTRPQAASGRMGDAATDRVTLPSKRAERRRGRTLTWTGSAVRDMVYRAAVLVWSVACFTILVTGVAVTATLLFLIVGGFVWISFVHVLRCTWIDRYGVITFRFIPLTPWVRPASAPSADLCSSPSSCSWRSPARRRTPHSPLACWPQTGPHDTQMHPPRPDGPRVPGSLFSSPSAVVAPRS